MVLKTLMILKLGQTRNEISWEGVLVTSDETTKDLYQVADFPIGYRFI